jgi:epoxyqueuosine reductase
MSDGPLISKSALPSQALKAKAEELGFMLCQVARAEYMEAEARRLEVWLNQGYHGKMDYMANYFDLRVDPTLLVPGAQSVICLAYNYHNPQKAADPQAPQISQYAYGEDYHRVVRRQLKKLFAWIRETYGHVEGRVFVDSAPVLERDWARRAGLGWVGKHTLAIHPRKGSYFFLAEIILDLAFETDTPIKDYCGTCTRCIDACPTGAISAEGYLLDGSKCISYLTIELKEAIPNEYKDDMAQWAFGCDICQDVCPWNRFATPHEEAAFETPDGLLEMDSRQWLELTEETFQAYFGKSALKRTGFKRFKENIRFVSGLES